MPRRSLDQRRVTLASRRAAAASAGVTRANWQQRMQAAQRQWREQVAAFRAGAPAPPIWFRGDDWPER